MATELRIVSEEPIQDSGLRIVNEEPVQQGGLQIVSEEPLRTLAPPPAVTPVRPAKEAKGFGDWIGEQFSKSNTGISVPGVDGSVHVPQGLKLLPIVGDVLSGAELGSVIMAARRVNDNSATDDDYRLLEEYQSAQEREANTDKSFGYKVADVVSQIPQYATAIGIGKKAARKLGGKAVEKAAQEIIERAVKKTLARKAVSGTVRAAGLTAATIAANPQMVARTAAQNIVTKTVDPRLQAASQNVQATGQDWKPALDEALDGYQSEAITQILKAYPEVAAEVMSEYSGGALKLLPVPKRISAIKAAILAKLRGKGGKLAEKAAKLAKELEWHGPLPEMFEERVADLMHEAAQGINVEEKYGKESPALVRMVTGEGGRAAALKEFANQMAVEAVAFQIPGAAVSAAQKASNAMSPRQEGWDELAPESKAKWIRKGLKNPRLDIESLDNIYAILKGDTIMSASDKAELARLVVQKGRGLKGSGPLIAQAKADIAPQEQAAQAEAAKNTLRPQTIRQQLGVADQAPLPAVITGEEQSQPLPEIQKTKKEQALENLSMIERLGLAYEDAQKIQGAVPQNLPIHPQAPPSAPLELPPQKQPVSLSPSGAPVPYEQAIQQAMPGVEPTLPINPQVPESTRAITERDAIRAAFNNLAAETGISLEDIEKTYGKRIDQFTPAEAVRAVSHLRSLSKHDTESARLTNSTAPSLARPAPSQPVSTRLNASQPVSQRNVPVQPAPAPQAATPTTTPAKPLPAAEFRLTDDVTTPKGKGRIMEIRRDAARNVIGYMVRIKKGKKDNAEYFPASDVTSTKRAGGIKIDPAKSLENAVIYEGGVNPEMVKKEGLWGEWERIPAGRRRRITRKDSRRSIGELAAAVATNHAYQVDGSNFFDSLADDKIAKKGTAVSDDYHNEQVQQLLAEYEMMRKENDQLRSQLQSQDEEEAIARREAEAWADGSEEDFVPFDPEKVGERAINYGQSVAFSFPPETLEKKLLKSVGVSTSLDKLEGSGWLLPNGHVVQVDNHFPDLAEGVGKPRSQAEKIAQYSGLIRVHRLHNPETLAIEKTTAEATEYQLRQLRNFKYMHPTVGVMWEDVPGRNGSGKRWRKEDLGKGMSWGTDWETILARLSGERAPDTIQEQKSLYGEPEFALTGGSGAASQKKLTPQEAQRRFEAEKARRQAQQGSMFGGMAGPLFVQPEVAEERKKQEEKPELTEEVRNKSVSSPYHAAIPMNAEVAAPRSVADIIAAIKNPQKEMRESPKIRGVLLREYTWEHFINSAVDYELRPFAPTLKEARKEFIPDKQGRDIDKWANDQARYNKGFNIRHRAALPIAFNDIFKQKPGEYSEEFPYRGTFEGKDVELYRRQGRSSTESFSEVEVVKGDLDQGQRQRLRKLIQDEEDQYTGRLPVRFKGEADTETSKEIDKKKPEADATLDQIDLVIAHQFTEGFNREVAKWQQVGATDEEIKALLDHNFGYQSGGDVFGTNLTYAAKSKDQKSPKLWINSSHSEKPTIEGKALIDRARIALNIPKPNEESPLFGKPEGDEFVRRVKRENPNWNKIPANKLKEFWLSAADRVDVYREKLREKITPEEFIALEKKAAGDPDLWNEPDLLADFWGRHAKARNAITPAQHQAIARFGRRGLEEPSYVAYGKETVARLKKQTARGRQKPTDMATANEYWKRRREAKAKGEKPPTLEEVKADLSQQREKHHGLTEADLEERKSELDEQEKRAQELDQQLKEEKPEIGASAAELKPIESFADENAQAEVDRRAQFVRDTVMKVINGKGSWSDKRRALNLPTGSKWDKRSIDKIPDYRDVPISPAEIRAAVSRELADTIAQTGLKPTEPKTAQQPAKPKAALPSLFESMEAEPEDDDFKLSEGSARYGRIGDMMQELGLKDVVLEDRSDEFPSFQEWADKRGVSATGGPDLDTNAAKWQREKNNFFEKHPSPKYRRVFTSNGESVGENYREVFVTAPNQLSKLDGDTLRARLQSGKISDEQFDEAAKGGWGDGHPEYSEIENPVVRVIMWDATGDNGEKILFVRELQPPNKENQAKMPSNLRNKWREIGMRWAVDHAAKNGYDKLALATGEMAAGTYDLSKKIDEIAYNEESGKLVAFDNEGTELINETVDPDDVEKYIGKERARRLFSSERDVVGFRAISGEGMTVGGEGLKRLYDEDLPNVLKRFGATIEATSLDTHGKPEIRERATSGGFWIEGGNLQDWQRGVFTTKREAEETLATILERGNFTRVPSIDLADFRDNPIDTDRGMGVSESYERPKQTRRETIRSIEVRDDVSSARRNVAPRGRRGASLLGLGITPAISAGEWVDPVGRRFRGVEDGVAVGRLFRNAQFETLHTLMVRDGKIVKHRAVSSRLPKESRLFTEPTTREGVANLIKEIESVGADEVWIIHNHPSGDVKISDDDRAATAMLVKAIPSIKGHIIIDHTTYSHIAQDGSERQYLTLPNEVPDLIHEPSIPHEGLGEEITGDAALAAWGKKYALASPDNVTVIYANKSPKGYAAVRAIESVPLSVFVNPAEFKQHIVEGAREYGGADAFAYYSNSKSIPTSKALLYQMMEYAEDGLLLDGVVEGFQGTLFSGFPKHPFGLTTDEVVNSTVRLREPGTKYWHGSPHKFDKFSVDKIGSGEGAQAYGYGLYFAGKKEIAEYYRKSLSESSTNAVYTWKGQTYQARESGEAHALSLVYYEGIPTAKKLFARSLAAAKAGEPWAIETGNVAYWQRLVDLVGTIKNKSEITQSRGHLYQVELAPKEDEYLVWDKPLSEQSQKVKAALASAMPNKNIGVGDIGAKTIRAYARRKFDNSVDGGMASGHSLYSLLAGQMAMNSVGGAHTGDKAASEYLHSLGIRGIKYFDGSSRAAADTKIEKGKFNDGSPRYTVNGPNGDKHFSKREDAQAYLDDLQKNLNYNYVIFSDDDVSIQAVMEKRVQYGNNVANQEEEGVSSEAGEPYGSSEREAESGKERSLAAPGRGGYAERASQGAHDSAIRRHAGTSQTIVTIEQADNWLSQRGLKPSGLYSPLFAIRKMQQHPDWADLSIDDRARLQAQLQRVPRSKTYADTRLVQGAAQLQAQQNSKSSGEIGIQGQQNAKVEGSGILTEDTIVGCYHGCPNCYGEGGAQQAAINFGQPVRKPLAKGSIREDQLLRIGTRGDPSMDWAWSAAQVKAKIEESQAKGHNVSAEKNVMAITNLHDVTGFDPEAFPNLEVTLDPQQLAHMHQAMNNLLRIKANYPEVNIAVRIKTVASLSDDMMERQYEAVEFANRFAIPVLETKMRFKGEYNFNTFYLDPRAYVKETKVQFKLKNGQLKDKADRYAICDDKGDGCPGCLSCRRLMIEDREKNIAAMSEAIEREGIATEDFRGVPRKLDVVGPSKLVQVKEEDVRYGARTGAEPKDIYDDEGDVENAKIASFGDESYVRYVQDSQKGIRILGIYRDPSDKTSGREMLQWLRSEFKGRKISAAEVAPDAVHFWNKMEDEGLVDGWSYKPFTGRGQTPNSVREGNAPYNPRPSAPIDTDAEMRARWERLVAFNKAERRHKWIPLPGDAEPPKAKRPTLFWRSPNNVLSRMGVEFERIADLITEASRAKKASHLEGHTYGMQHYDDIANEIIKECKIKRGSNEDQMVMDLLDEAFTGLTPEELRRTNAYKGDKEAAIAAAKRFRDEIFEPIIQHVRGDKELSDIIGKKGYIRGYFPHYYEQMRQKYGEKSAAAIARAVLPERFTSKFLNERKSNNWVNDTSIFEVVPSYIGSMMKTVHDIPAYDKARRIVEDLPAGPEKDYANWYIQNYMGIKANVGGMSEFVAESKMMKLSSKVAQLYYDNLIGLNPKTWIINLTQTLTNTVPEIGFEYTLKGARQLFGSKEARQKFHDSGLLLDYPGMESGIVGEGLKRKIMHGGMSAAEYVNRGITYLAGLEQAKDMGLVGKAAQMHAMDLVDKTQFSYGAEAQSELLAKLPPDMRVFQTFKLKQTEYVRNLVADAWNKEPEARAKLGRFLALNVLIPSALKLAGISLGAIALESFGFTLWDLIPGLPRTATLFSRFSKWMWQISEGKVKPEDIPGDIVDGLYEAFFPGANAINQVGKLTGVTDKKFKPSALAK